ncbi:MAG: HNH endonuclease signature motif containing protein [Bacteroidaceae bacterium]
MRKIWNEESIGILKELYPVVRTDELAKRLGVSVNSVYNQASLHGLKKTDEYLHSYECGIFIKGRIRLGSEKTVFKKGHIPANKGKKQSEYMTKEQIANCARSKFKKGHVPGNKKPVGYERINRDGYVEVKTAEPNIFEAKHRLVWRQHRGEIPPGMNIQFRDGNKTNVTIDNLYMINRSRQMKTENSMYARYPKELQHLYKLKGALNRQINNASKKQK